MKLLKNTTSGARSQPLTDAHDAAVQGMLHSEAPMVEQVQQFREDSAAWVSGRDSTASLQLSSFLAELGNEDLSQRVSSSPASYPSLALLPLSSPQSELQRLDFNELCRQAWEREDDVLLCGVVDLSARELLGLYHPDPNLSLVFSSALLSLTADAFSERSIFKLEHILAGDTAPVEPDHRISDSFLRTPHILYFMQRVPHTGIVVVFCMDADTNLGWGWAELRRLVRRIHEQCHS